MNSPPLSPPASPLSFWHDDACTDWTPSRPLDGDLDVDVAIVGGGYTGLWTAYYLAKSDPGLRIAILEKNYVGFGASGRNGGWCSAIFPATLRKIARESSRAAAIRMQHEMFRTVEEVGAVVEAENIDCDFTQAGYLSLARNEAQWIRSQREVDGWRSWGFGEEHLRLLNPAETASRVEASRSLGATFTPHCAALQPAKLVRGLGDVVRALGVRIHEGTEVQHIRSGGLLTARGSVRADVVVRATEGYTAQMSGSGRDIVPMYSMMVATAPIPEDVWSQIGLSNRETFSDKRHLRIYGQRTGDGRIAFGGRGAPYHFGSRVKPQFDHDRRVHEMLRGILVDLFRPLKGIEFTHAWGGNLAIPRDWFPTVGYDRGSGIAHSGGYVGDGVATANLAGRTLTAEILNLDSDLRSLPWVGRTTHRWEPEPLRWIGVNAVTAAFKLADRSEALSRRPSRLASGVWTALGH